MGLQGTHVTAYFPAALVTTKKKRFMTSQTGGEAEGGDQAGLGVGREQGAAGSGRRDEQVRREDAARAPDEEHDAVDEGGKAGVGVQVAGGGHRSGEGEGGGKCGGSQVRNKSAKR